MERKLTIVVVQGLPKAELVGLPHQKPWTTYPSLASSYIMLAVFMQRAHPMPREKTQGQYYQLYRLHKRHLAVLQKPRVNRT